MTTMSEMFRNQQNDPKMKDIPFEEWFAMLVDAEHASRKSHAFERLVKKAELEQNDVGVATIDYHSGRKLNKALIQKLASCEYISQYRNIFITGATGSGKTYLACAFGMEACKRFYSVRFTRLPDLLMDLSAAEDRHALENALQKYTKPTLLIWHNQNVLMICQNVFLRGLSLSQEIPNCRYHTGRQIQICVLK